VDPLAGSYFVESLTDRLEEEAWKNIRAIDGMGGIVPAIEQGFPQREIAEASYLYQRQVDHAEKIVVGVNRYVEGDTMKAPLLKIGPEVERAQVDRLLSVRAGRDGQRHARALGRLEEAARGKTNLMEAVLEAVRAYASVGEICDALKKVFSTYQEGRVHL
jgi:methylmalonyl-CoA mutase N-terminal domain/subunit